VAVSVVLLVIATGIYRTFRHQITAGPGYRIDHLLMMTFDPSLVGASTSETARFYEQLVDRAQRVPGVRSVALASVVPMQLFDLNATPLVPEGNRLPPGKETITLISAVVDEHYFSTLLIPIVRGRAFRVEDGPASPRVAIVNELVAAHYWPGQDAIGKRFRRPLENGASVWVEIVGVAKTSKYLFMAEPPTEYVYFPYRQESPSTMVLLAHSAGNPADLSLPLRQAAAAIDPRQPIYNVRTMQEFFDLSTVGLFNAVTEIIGFMGVLGFGLSLVGLYALVAYAASRRTKEIGIRMAIGAGRGAVLRMIMRQGIVLAAAGLAIGLAASVGAGAMMRAAFPGGDRSTDFASLAIVAPAVLVVTTMAAFLPARRASRIDPMIALRED
jgi:predicted permease